VEKKEKKKGKMSSQSNEGDYLFPTAKSVKVPRVESSMSIHDKLRLFLQIATLVVVILGLVLILVSVVRSSKADVEIRRIIEATPQKVVGGAGEANAWLRGKFVENYEDMDIDYDFYYSTSTSAIQSIVVRGPKVIGSNTGPILFSICGAPGTKVCDLTTTPGRITGNLKTLEPANVATLPVMRNIRANPDLYYFEVWTSAVPAEPGALRSELMYSMGPDL
jgi:hypothetical protein